MIASTLFLLSSALADPCGMVPPIWLGDGKPPTGIERTGVQQTYAFHRDGVETIAIRPGFIGSVEQFGMLVPLPATPELRKLDDAAFGHIAAAVDPPFVQVHLYEESPLDDRVMMRAASAPTAEMEGMELSRDEVVVVKEEAVGMYEVAVLAAGSSAALQRWMDEHSFRYPDGMDDVVEDYVRSRWLFVAVKARVGAGSGVQPHPGMRSVDPSLPQGSSFEGYVQGMAFRFRSEEPVIPMRLSTFNGDDTHNRVYLLAEQPLKIEGVSAELVKRQVDGRTLVANLTEPLPLQINGEKERIGASWWEQIEAQRDPAPYNGVARDLFGSDVLAVQRGTLSLPFEEREKALLNISEQLGLRGPAIDTQLQAEVAARRAEALEPALADLYEMTLTVVDGDYPRTLLRDENLTMAAYTMPRARNTAEHWTQRPAGPEIWVPYTPGWTEKLPWPFGR